MSVKSLFIVSFKLLISTGLTLVFLEIGLRLFPGVIPLDILILFDDEPRAEIALRRGLPTKQETILLDRDDGGPALRLHMPLANTTYYPGNDRMIQVIMDEIGFCNPVGVYRAWALCHNFWPYCPRAKVSQPYLSPAHKLNGFVYHQNWLHNLLISASSTGLKPNHRKC